MNARGLVRVILVVLAAGALPHVVCAQRRIEITGAFSRVGTATVVQGIAESGSGSWYGAQLRAELGPVTIEGGALKGTIAPASGSSGLNQDGGEMRGVLGLRAASWLALEGSYTLRAFDSPAGYQKWTMPGAGMRLSAQLGTPALRGYIRAHYLFGVSVSGEPAAKLGLGIETGVRLLPGSSPTVLELFHRFERIDFPNGTAGRLDHFDVLGVRAGVSFGAR